MITSPPPDDRGASSADPGRAGCGCAALYVLLTSMLLVMGSLTASSCDTFFGLAFGACVPSLAILPALPWVVLFGIPSMPKLVLAYGINLGLSVVVGRWWARHR